MKFGLDSEFAIKRTYAEMMTALRKELWSEAMAQNTEKVKRAHLEIGAGWDEYGHLPLPQPLFLLIYSKYNYCVTY